MDIVEFLRARLDEDEAAALATQPDSTWLRGKTWWLEGVEHEMVTTPNGGEVAFTHLGYVDHIARHDPARVLREVEAKREVVDGALGCYEAAERDGGDFQHGIAVGHTIALRCLAAIYVDHPDYDPEWSKG